MGPHVDIISQGALTQGANAHAVNVRICSSFLCADFVNLIWMKAHISLLKYQFFIFAFIIALMFNACMY